MTDYVLQPKPINPHEFENVALGVNAAGKLTSLDEAKALKLGTNGSTYVLCADGDDIEGILSCTESHTVNSGFGFGTIQKKGIVYAKNAGAGAIAVGAYVVAAAQPAVGTEIVAITVPTRYGWKPVPVKAGAGVTFKWRVIDLLSGAGAVGTTIAIQKI